MSDSSAISQRLQKLAKNSPNLKHIVRFYETILPLLETANLHVQPVDLDAEQAKEKLAKGFPLLHDVALALDFGEARRIMITLCGALEQAADSSQNTFKKLKRALEQEKIDISQLMAHVTANDQESVLSLVQPLGIDGGRVRTLTSYVLRPALYAWRRQLSHLIEEAAWNRRCCPICGAMPVFAELQGHHLQKHLRCNCCCADWPARRMHCLYCGNEDHRTLGVLFEDSRHDTVRLEICEQCKGYIKVIVTFSPTTPEQLPVLDLETIHLNYIAEERGYRMNGRR
jgi:FdhE protein